MATWTTQDEALYRDATEHRTKILEERIKPIDKVIGKLKIAGRYKLEDGKSILEDQTIQAFIDNATELRRALAPFDHESQASDGSSHNYLAKGSANG